LRRIVTVRAQNTTAHTVIAGKISDRNALHAQSPGCEQVEGAVPGKIVEAAGSFEKGNGPDFSGLWRNSGNTQRHAKNPPVIEMAGEAALDVLGKKFFQLFFPARTRSFKNSSLLSILG
jgi:hypothetical protein